MPHHKTQYDPTEEAAFNSAYSRHDVDGFQQRQALDHQRYQYQDIRRRRAFHKRFDHDGEQGQSATDEDSEGEEGWRGAEGDRLADYGVDEDAEFYDEDDIPLSVLAKRLRDPVLLDH